MRGFYGQTISLFVVTVFGSCTIYDKIFDNPVDFKANEEQGIGAPTLVFYPKTQTVTQSDSLLIGSFIVFMEDSIEPFSGVHLQIQFPNDLVELDTIVPGLFITDTNKATPLFTYTYDNDNTVNIYTYFLDTLKQDISGTGHLANLVFNPISSGTDSIYYNLQECEMIDHLDQEIVVNGIRGAEVIIQ